MSFEAQEHSWSYGGKGQPFTTHYNLVNNSFIQTFLGSELRQLALAWLVLSFCFSIRYLFFSRERFLLMFLISLATLGLGFIGHELSHKYVAQRFGCWAEFRLSPYGLVMALLFALVSGGSIIFAAPGAVYIVQKNFEYGYRIGRKENGLISLSGPSANIVVALFFLAVRDLGGILGLMGSTGFYVNLWLAAFNLIPFGMMDGRKVLAWSPMIWALVAVPSWIAIFFL
jgi:Zn-dependent protease